MGSRFLREKEQILSQYILHHEVSDAEVGELAERLDAAVQRADELHSGQRRKTGEEYIWHPIHTAMEVSRFGRIIDWASIEAALLHDTLEDTPYSYPELKNEFPEAANLVLALTKIKDSRVHTYQKLFRYVLQDIRVLLVKLADRLDNLETLAVFRREKQVRIARESAEMYANICRRLCMSDLAERLAEKIGPILTPQPYAAFQRVQMELKEGWTRPIEELRGKLSEIFREDLGARIELHWNRFRPDVAPLPENLFTARIVAKSGEDAYRALGRIHLAFPALPGTFTDTFSTPRKNGYRALETRVAYQGRIVSFYVSTQAADRFNRLGLLSMDITSPRFNLEYLEDLRDFLMHEEMNIQDFLRFHRPDSIQVISPEGEVFSLEDGATALDYAFAVHEKLGLRAVSARVNGVDVELERVLRPGDRVEILTAAEAVADDRYLSWAHTRRAQTSLRRHAKGLEAERAAATGKQWLLEAAQATGVAAPEAEERARDLAAQTGIGERELYRRLCLGSEEISRVLGSPPEAKGLAAGLLRRWRGREEPTRRVRRYEFENPHIRFCPRCSPVEGDEIEAAPDGTRLVVHRVSCTEPRPVGTVALAWEKSGRGDLRDPGPIELELGLVDKPGALYSILAPFKDLGLDIRHLKLPGSERKLGIHFRPETDRTLNRLIRALRKSEFVEELRVFRAQEEKR